MTLGSYWPNSAASRVVAAHKANPRMTAKAIATALDLKLHTVRAAAHQRGIRLPNQNASKRPYCRKPRTCPAGERGYCPLCTGNVAEIREKISVGRQRSIVAREAQVPAWATKAGLADDYRDFVVEFGEHDAARRCRELIKEATANA